MKLEMDWHTGAKPLQIKGYQGYWRIRKDSKYEKIGEYLKYIKTNLGASLLAFHHLTEKDQLPGLEN